MRSRIAKVVLAVALAGVAAPAAAQSFTRQRYVEPSPRTLELTPWAGLFWSSGVNTSIGTLVFDVAPDVGAVLDIQVDGKSQVEVLYLLARPQARFDSTNPFYASSPSFGVTTQYLQIGGLTTFDQGAVEPFLSGGLGLAWYHPSDVQPAEGTISLQPQDAWVFAFHLGGGVKWWISEAIGLRLAARFLLPVFFNAGAFLSGPNGAMLRVNAGIPVVQGDVSLGLAISP